jgi:hypothetical protein
MMTETIDLTLLDDEALQQRIAKLRVKKRIFITGGSDFEILKNLECQCHLEQLARYYKKHDMQMPEPALPATRPEPMKARESRHKAGSRKAQVHDVFLARGEDAAVRLGKSLNLSDATVVTWIRVWKRESI